jgi:hypothetical protein
VLWNEQQLRPLAGVVGVAAVVLLALCAAAMGQAARAHDH